MSERFEVAYLLGISKLPDRFYSRVKKLVGRDQLYQNPGVSLRSFVVGRHLLDEMVEVDDEMLKTVRECEQFNVDFKALSEIVSRVTLEAKDLIAKLDGDMQLRRTFVSQLSDLRRLQEAVKINFDKLLEANHQKLMSPERLRLIATEINELLLVTSPLTVVFKHSLFKLSDLLDTVEETLPKAPAPEYA